ncbi:tetratricopeptide repeat protein [Phaeobacter sp. QD34_3]|uniref:tetratricopeptide repeat protein n=1 Tax=unclassified Phaeobacter TaxID=2621772 RepID=UPI00237FBA08|nr:MULTISPECIES: tetratricopeptide repeat protein [unclassified Phaeobacter]MDE4132690.1 tetratricopeptide repeat protein [Phaeobacter sp. QD34_3]MDE4136517.1 tetratricopeptide repeat protein [Phaeobacter sp. QD34_24]
MADRRRAARRRPCLLTAAAALVAVSVVGACSLRTGAPPASPWAPGVDLRKQAEDGLIVGHRLMDAGEYELALDAFNRAALEQGLTAEVLSSMGSANLGLGRLGQAEDLLRRATKAAPDWPEALNNLGVVLMERGKTPEAVQILRRAYALDNGESDAIRDNLRRALEKLENSAHSDPQNESRSDFTLMRQGGGSYRIGKDP